MHSTNNKVQSPKEYECIVHTTKGIVNPSFAKAADGQATLRQGYGVASHPSLKLRKGKPSFAKATEGQATLRQGYGVASHPSLKLRKGKR